MCDIIGAERSKMQSDKLKISTKGQINDSKLSQDDYEANLLLVRKAVESMQVAYDCISDILRLHSRKVESRVNTRGIFILD